MNRIHPDEFSIDSSLAQVERIPTFFPKEASIKFFQQFQEDQEKENPTFSIISFDEKSFSLLKPASSEDSFIESPLAKKGKKKEFFEELLIAIPRLIPIEISINPQEIVSVASASKLHPVYLPIEKMIQIQDQTTSLSSLKSITYLSPTSPLNGLEIKLEFFDTHPRSINIELVGSPKACEYLSNEIQNLQNLLKFRFETIDFPQIRTSIAPIFPTGFSKQKSKNPLSEKKVAEGKIVFKPITSVV
jgi:hypothetical protein